MENNKNGIGDFLRKKFADFEEVEGGWARPDQRVREEVLQQITTPIGSVGAYWATGWVTLGGVILFLAGVYIWRLQNQMTELVKVVQQQEIQLKKIGVEFLDLKEKQGAEKNAWKDKLVTTEANFQTKINDLNTLIEQQSYSLWQAHKDNQKLEEQYVNYRNAIAGLEQKMINFTAFFEKNAPIAQANLTVVNPIPTLPFSFLVEKELAFLKPSLRSSIKPQKKQWKRFEIGYKHTFSQFGMSVNGKFKDLKSASDNLKNNEFVLNFLGGTVGFSFHPNWWIQTGFRKASVEVQQGYILNTFYDNTTEELLRDGSIKNDLLLIRTTPYSNTENNITVYFEPRKGLENGELLVVSLYENIGLKYTQLPLGVEYFYGNEAFQWSLQGGIQWNKISFSDYRVSTEVSAKGRDIRTETERLVKAIPTYQFLTTYGGVGFNYQLFQHWQLRGNLIYNYQLTNKNKVDFSTKTNSNQSYQLSLNYRF